MRDRIWALLLVSLPPLVVSCQRANAAEPKPVGAAESAPERTGAGASGSGGAASGAPGRVPAAEKSGAPSKGTEHTGTERGAAADDEDAEHCPPEMVYVEGEYCTSNENTQKPDAHGNTPGAGAKDVEAIVRVCEKEWYAEQNKKRVCEDFAEEAKCSGKLVKKRYCIDRYEWPNVKGQRPEVMNRFYQAEVKCAAAGKRLCTESEWTFACEGEEMLPFPYGTTRDATKCHGDEEWDAPNMSKVADRNPEELRRLYKAERSGESACVSPFGVHDLPGNADEIAASETFEPGWRGKYESITTGGPWYKGVRNQCRPKIYTHDEGFYYYYLSFRCCAEADGAVTDPRTPKQRAGGKTMEWVERQAGFTVKEIRALYEKARTDPTCGCKTTRCKTLCGTLHGDPGTGPDAWNPPLLDQVGNGMFREESAD